MSGSMFDAPEFSGYDDGATLLDDVAGFLRHYVVHPSDAARTAHVLWIAHTWLMDCWDSTPRIAFLSPEPGSGKSRALEVTEPLVPRPVHAVNVTPAYLFRKVSDEAGAPTILYDEIDTVFGPKAKDNEDVRGMLNAGHRKGATAGRCVMRGKIVETEELPAYCAVAFAGLNDLPDTISSRSVVIHMRRRAGDEKVEPWRPRLTRAAADSLRDRLANWSRANADRIEWPDMPNEVTDRDADVWEALLAVADLAGGHWPGSARAAAVTLVTQSRQRPPSIGVLLLRDVRSVFDESGVDILRGDQIIVGLNAMPEAPWQTIRRGGNPLDQRGLSQRLGRYDITSKSHRTGGIVVRGYAREQFTDAWKRYLAEDCDDVAAPSSEKSVTSVTGVTPQVSAYTAPDGCNGNAPFVTEADSVPPTQKHALTRDVTDVTDVTDFRGDQAPPVPPGGVTVHTPGQTSRVARALATAARAAADNGMCQQCGDHPANTSSKLCDWCG